MTKNGEVILGLGEVYRQRRRRGLCKRLREQSLCPSEIVLVAQLIGGIAKGHNNGCHVAGSSRSAGGELKVVRGLPVLPSPGQQHAQVELRSRLHLVITGRRRRGHTRA